MKKFTPLFLFMVVFSTTLFSQNVDTCNCRIALDNSFQVVPMTEGPDAGMPPLYENDNAASGPIPLPFTFCFYGQTFDTVYISNNGIISFAKPIYDFISHGGFPLGTDTLIIAPFYADAYTLNHNGTVHYKITPTYMVVIWDSIGYGTLDIDYFNTFQLIITNGSYPILPQGNNVSFCYTKMEWASADASGGFGGFSGIPAFVGVNRGNDYAQFGRFNVPGITYYGPFEALDGTDWLNGKSFIFNTCVTGNNIAPAILKSEQNCDTATVCAGNTVTIKATFLPCQQGQKSILTASCPDIEDLVVIDTTNGNGIDSITVQLTPTVAEVGSHTLNISATDNTFPQQTSNLPVTIVVNLCTGIEEPTLENDFSIYPNPANGIFTIEMKDEQLPVHGEVKIYDVIGREVYSTKLNTLKTEIDLSYRTKGVYFLNLSGENLPIAVKKIIVN